MKYLFSLIFLILFSPFIFAQNQTIEITGKVIESASQQAIGDIRGINEK